MNRSQHTIDYQGIPPGNLKKRLGFTLGSILLLLGVTTGYWYKKSIEIPLPSGSQKLPDSTRELIIDPAPPIHSFSSNPTHILNSPMEDPGLRTYELENEKRASLSSQENAIVKSSISGGQSVPEIHPVPEQPKDSRPQDSSSITKQPSSQKILVSGHTTITITQTFLNHFGNWSRDSARNHEGCGFTLGTSFRASHRYKQGHSGI